MVKGQQHQRWYEFIVFITHRFAINVAVVLSSWIIRILCESVLFWNNLIVSIWSTTRWWVLPNQFPHNTYLLKTEECRSVCFTSTEWDTWFEYSFSKKASAHSNLGNHRFNQRAFGRRPSSGQELPVPWGGSLAKHSITPAPKSDTGWAVFYLFFLLDI